jgi:hypothetical protein
LSPSATSCSSWSLLHETLHTVEIGIRVSPVSLLVRLASFCGLLWNMKFHSHLLRRLPVPFFSQMQRDDLHYVLVNRLSCLNCFTVCCTEPSMDSGFWMNLFKLQHAACYPDL